MPLKRAFFYCKMSERFLHNPDINETPKSADVVIIGGGMAGPAASWALNREMPGIKTVLIEKASQLATGASASSIENFRSCWPTPCLIAQMSRSMEIFTHADEYLGEGAAKALNVRQRGYLYTGVNLEQAATLKSEVEDLQKKGLTHVEYLNEEEINHRFPYLGEHVVAAKFDPTAGWLESNSLAYLFARAGKDAKFLTGIDNTSIIVEKDKVVGVMTNNGLIKTEKVVIAAGPGSRQVGRTAGIELPIIMRPRHSFTTAYRHPSIPEDAPFIIGNEPFAYMRPEKTGSIFGWEYEWVNKVDPENGAVGYLTEPLPKYKVKDPIVPGMVLDALNGLFGDIFSEDKYLRGGGVDLRVDYYVSRSPENSYKDENSVRIPIDSQRAIVDKYPGLEGLYLSISHVGHGVMASAASGEIVAAHVLGQDQRNPLFYDFGINVHWVPEDGGSL